MASPHILYLGSQSSSRRQLLEWAGLPFTTLTHNCDEKSIAFNGDPEEHVIAIARGKMANLELPCAQTIGAKIFVLTADTLIFTTHSGQILGKPEDKADAIRILQILQKEPALVVTGSSLVVYEWNGAESAWKMTHEKNWATGATVEFIVDDHSMEWYFEQMPEAMHGCGAGILEKYGQGFLKAINGSYSAVLGLPLFELRQELQNLGFF